MRSHAVCGHAMRSHAVCGHAMCSQVVLDCFGSGYAVSGYAVWGCAGLRHAKLRSRLSRLST